MADYVAFVNNNDDCRILGKYYSDARACRLLLGSAGKLVTHIPANLALWIDPGVDAYEHIWANKWPVDILSQSEDDAAKTWPRDKDGNEEKGWKLEVLDRWRKQFSRFRSYRTLMHKDCWKKAHEQELQDFVSDILEACLAFKPTWITIPQLPVGKEKSRVNKSLAQAAGNWKEQKKQDIRLVLPVVVTGTSILGRKPTRDETLKLALNCCSRARADAVWVVDTTLNDQSRNEQFSARYETLIQFHEALRDSFPRTAEIVAGPYWGINLILWARGLCTFPAVSMGTSYTYHIPGGRPSPGVPRLAIPPLRRWVMASEELPEWLDTALNDLNPSDNAYGPLFEIRRNFAVLKQKAAATDQVARFYAEWFRKIQAVEPEGRALGLYQDLSSAFVLGRQLPPLPKTTLPEAPEKVRSAETVAKQLMLHCL